MQEILRKVTKTLKDEGIASVGKKARSYIKTKNIEKKLKTSQVFQDVLFINGCGPEVPHPARYRVSHQREQLTYYNISSNEVFYQHLSMDMVRLYRGFIFFRCPYNEQIGEFIKLAKKLNKVVLYDIDDLVIDTKYTDMIPYLDTMKSEDRKAYNQNVMEMGHLLRLCDAGITTTTHLQQEMLHYVPEVLINRNTASEEMEKLSDKALQSKKELDHIHIGYFSGSITHNDDFNMIMPVIIELMKTYHHLKLHIVGELELPGELNEYKEQIIQHPFVDWRKLPELIAQVDINLAPLTDTLFNAAKSENKWMEAALVQVPTIASNLGAFEECIESGETGILCSSVEDWKEALVDLIENPDKRNRIARNAWYVCRERWLAYKTGYKLAEFLKKKFHKNIIFVLPSLEISGGVMVTLNHAAIMQKRGYDVSVAYLNAKENWCTVKAQKIPVLHANEGVLEGSIDAAVATMWTTVQILNRNSKIKNKYYLVQNYETNFYQSGDPLRIQANRTYSENENIKYLTISKWCESWLKTEFGKTCKYAPNGIEFDRFHDTAEERTLSGKIRILIEGDCASYYKNVDESFEIVNKLEKEKFEIWYMSYNAQPKEWYRVDKFFHKVPYAKVAQIYRECDILIKTSVLESFSYPPLEMMATGGLVLAVPNGGNVEYLEDGKNCLLYEQGDIEQAVSKINQLCTEKELRHKLYIEGLKTAKERDWNNIESAIESLYMEES
ncbi:MULTISPECIES: glycosyltransferase [Ruminococcus]|uniref:Glycosyltransferase n=1 Tax=Ruminococcus hominis TaxID=2763065 RepID=A0ABR7GB69_9FIRM|nr:glycosyltransferase [Ruminococcus hominis]MBC5684682.1 glycosyltransferase [Ruminococcus hominis]